MSTKARRFDLVTLKQGTFLSLSETSVFMSGKESYHHVFISWSQSSRPKEKPAKRRMFMSNTNADNCTSPVAGSSPNHGVHNDADTQKDTKKNVKELL